MKMQSFAIRTGRRLLGKGLAWAQVNHPERVARAIQFAISRKSSSKKPAMSSAPKVAGMDAAMQAAGVPESLQLKRNSGIQAASAIAGITPEQATTLEEA
ncbi:hypothetical protein [Corynebacterium gerontici]|uniref:Uncharacterized protein n=1 Tax=Corynebacterium gerontici TaxID=2079234 RepID=A0A3G6J2D9_9CORY|nr:hypothetical protein [Corynebacterium gerontici]AZA12102.1 hypothetical protein CGERO_09055 [Corynebacterium gerontici]